MKTFLGVTATALGVLGLLVIWVKVQESQGIYFPRTYEKTALKKLPPSVEYVEFQGETGPRLTGFWRSGDTNAPVVVLAHGNAGHALDRIFWFEHALPDGWHGLVFDYRGYGRSGGRPTEAGLYEDTLTATRWARQRTGEPPVVLHGRSLGVPPVAHTAAEMPVAGLVLESGFPNAAAVAGEILPLPGLSYLLSVDFDTVEYLDRARRRHGPVEKLIIHGESDRVLPFRLGRTLYEQSPPPKRRWFVPEAGHNDLIRVAGPRYRRRVTGFMEEAVKNRSPEGGVQNSSEN